MFEEFKKFAVRGNVLDLAVGVIIGAAFGAIVKSLVDDIIMPPIGMLIGNVDFSQLFWVLKEGAAVTGPYLTIDAARKAGAVTLNFGLFFNAIISFVLVAFSVFMLVRTLNRLRGKEEAPPPAPPTKTCGYCKSAIDPAATRCPHCTSTLDE
mgnify:FL=1